jgi:hypothetical protein
MAFLPFVSAAPAAGFVRFVPFLGFSLDSGVVAARSGKFPSFHPGVVAATPPAFKRLLCSAASSLHVGLVFLNGGFRLAWVSANTDNVGEKPLAKHSVSNVLHLMHLIFGGLRRTQNNCKLLTLVCAVEGVDGGMLWIHALEASNDAAVESPDEAIAYADGVLLPCSK